MASEALNELSDQLQRELRGGSGGGGGGGQGASSSHNSSSSSKLVDHIVLVVTLGESQDQHTIPLLLV